MRLRALALVAVVLVAPLSAGARPAAPAAPAATVIDRSLSCAATPDTVRKIVVSAESGFRDPTNQQRWKWPAGATLRSSGYFVVYAYVGTLPDLPPGAGQYRSLGINMGRCRASTARVPLSARGLTGGVASQLQGSDAYECVVARRVLIRVRAVFRAPATFRVRRSFGEPIHETATPAKDVQLAVRTQAGKPLAYARVSETGKATLFVAPGCASD